MYDVGEEDSDAADDQSQISSIGQSSPIPMQLPVVEVMKVLPSNPIISYSMYWTKEEMIIVDCYKIIHLIVVFFLVFVFCFCYRY